MAPKKARERSRGRWSCAPKIRMGGEEGEASHFHACNLSPSAVKRDQEEGGRVGLRREPR